MLVNSTSFLHNSDTAAMKINLPGGKSKQPSCNRVVRHTQAHIAIKKGNKKRGERRGHRTTMEGMSHLHGSGFPLIDQIRGKLE